MHQPSSTVKLKFSIGRSGQFYGTGGPVGWGIPFRRGDKQLVLWSVLVPLAKGEVLATGIHLIGVVDLLLSLETRYGPAQSRFTDRDQLYTK